jgi:tetratricopeptide (TPR) repeat protein
MINTIFKCYKKDLTGRIFSTSSLAIFFILAGLLLLGSCATTSQGRHAGTWRCDPQADQAVEDGDWEKAQVLHELLLREQPANCLALYHLGYIHGRFGDRLQEADFYNKALDCGYDQDVQLFFNLGMAYADSGRTDLALSVFERGAAVDPDHADIHFGAGVTALEVGRTAMAEKELGRAVSLDPRHWEARLALARLYLDQSRWEQARHELGQVQTGNPENEQAEELLEILEDRRAGEY